MSKNSIAKSLIYISSLPSGAVSSTASARQHTLSTIYNSFDADTRAEQLRAFFTQNPHHEEPIVTGKPRRSHKTTVPASFISLDDSAEDKNESASFSDSNADDNRSHTDALVDDEVTSTINKLLEDVPDDSRKTDEKKMEDASASVVQDEDSKDTNRESESASDDAGSSDAENVKVIVAKDKSTDDKSPSDASAKGDEDPPSNAFPDVRTDPIIHGDEDTHPESDAQTEESSRHNNNNNIHAPQYHDSIYKHGGYKPQSRRDTATAHEVIQFSPVIKIGSENGGEKGSSDLLKMLIGEVGQLSHEVMKHHGAPSSVISMAPPSRLAGMGVPTVGLAGPSGPPTGPVSAAVMNLNNHQKGTNAATHMSGTAVDMFGGAASLSAGTSMSSLSNLQKLGSRPPTVGGLDPRLSYHERHRHHRYPRSYHNHYNYHFYPANRPPIGGSEDATTIINAANVVINIAKHLLSYSPNTDLNNTFKFIRSISYANDAKNNAKLDLPHAQAMMTMALDVLRDGLTAASKMSIQNSALPNNVRSYPANYNPMLGGMPGAMPGVMPGLYNGLGGTAGMTGTMGAFARTTPVGVPGVSASSYGGEAAAAPIVAAPSRANTDPKVAELGALDNPRSPYKSDPYEVNKDKKIDEGLTNSATGSLSLFYDLYDRTVGSIASFIYPTHDPMKVLQSEERYAIARKRSEELHNQLQVATTPSSRAAILAEKETVDQEMQDDYKVIKGNQENEKRQQGISGIICLLILGLVLSALYRHFSSKGGGGGDDRDDHHRDDHDDDDGRQRGGRGGAERDDRASMAIGQ